jgi:putative FmdB family regulatory protein
MPTYEYRCRSCGATFESRRAIADADAPIACPEGHVDAARAMSLFIVSKSGDAARSAAASEMGCGPGCSCALAH